MKISRLLPVVGIALFIYILSKVDVSKVADGFSRINPAWFAIALGLFSLQHIIKAVRWKLLIDSYGLHYPLFGALKGWLIGYALSLITPGKVGDFARAYYLKDKMETGKALTTVMADRVIDLFVIFVLATIGISVFAANYVKDDFLLFGTYILFGFFVACLFVFSKKNVATRAVRPFFGFAPKKYRDRMLKVYHDFYAGLEALMKKKRTIVVTTAVTVFFWLVAILSTWALGVALGLNISYPFLLMVMPVVLILLALPISFSGIGTRDAALIFFFSYIGLTAEQTLSYTIMLLAMDYIFASPGFALFVKHPLKAEGKD